VARARADRAGDRAARGEPRRHGLGGRERGDGGRRRAAVPPGRARRLTGLARPSRIWRVLGRRARYHRLVAANVLVVASQTAGSHQLLDAITHRAERSPIRLTLLMPAQGPGLAGREATR